MKIIKTKFKGLLIFQKKTHFDNRGYTRELFLNKTINKNFPFDIISFSKKNVIRGLHLQIMRPQGKFISVLKGKIFDVVLDCRKKSNTFGKYYTTVLSDKKNSSLFIPEGFAHGYCSLTEGSLLHYKMTNYRHKENEIGILWNDTDINIKWPIKKPILSKRDKNNITFKEYLKLV